MLELRDGTRKSDKLYLLTRTYIKLTNKLVNSHSESLLVLGQATGNTDSLDSPRPGLGGSHHLTPYSILCITPSHLHPNGTFFRDSQSGVLKLSGFGLPGLWAFITSCSNLRLGWVLKQTYSSPWELSNGVLHSTCTHRGQVDSQLLMIGNQTTSLTLGPSFAHNISCICPNGSCKAILDIYNSRPFTGIKNTSMQGVLTPAIKLWVFGIRGGFQVLTFGSVSFILTLASQCGYDTYPQ